MLKFTTFATINNYKNKKDMEKEVMMNGENVREAYEAPKCEMIEMQNEGVLCGSGDLNSASVGNFWEEEYNGGWN